MRTEKTVAKMREVTVTMNEMIHVIQTQDNPVEVAAPQEVDWS
jgi:hypothetical protein